MTPPAVSIVVPVYNTGAYLREALRSILEQGASADGTVPPAFEVVVVDDHSDDPLTLQLLREAAATDPRVRVAVNARTKGAAGARNTGLLLARGAWIGFLDADDVWLADSLALRWRAIADNPAADWVAAEFLLWKPDTGRGGPASFRPAAQVIAEFRRPPGTPVVDRLQRPVDLFCQDCFAQVMTVLIRRAVIEAQGMFDERLPRAEDYKLWFKCAFNNDLHLVRAPVGFYRIHPASLTHGRQPRLLHEDVMVELLLQDPAADAWRKPLLRRFDLAMQNQCYFYREHRMFGAAFAAAARWLRKRPAQVAPYKELAACLLRAG